MSGLRSKARSAPSTVLGSAVQAAISAGFWFGTVTVTDVVVEVATAAGVGDELQAGTMARSTNAPMTRPAVIADRPRGRARPGFGADEAWSPRPVPSSTTGAIMAAGR